MEPKKFLFVSLEGLIGNAAWQVQKEGHEVKYCIQNPKEKETADGFVPKVDNWKNEVDWADVIVFDDVLGQGKKAQDLRARGKHVVGGTPYTDRLEDDRGFGQEELKKAGVPILPYQSFTSFDAAIDFVQKNPTEYVIKPNGEAANHKGLLFVGEDEQGRDVLQVLNDYKTAWEKKIPEFQLQKKVSGVEVAVGALFNGKEFVYPINVNFEHKKLFPGELGPSTGEMGTTMFWSSPNRIFNNTLKKMEAKLAEEGYVGYIDINCIVNGNGIYPLEWTARFGYPTLSIQSEGILTPMGELFFTLAHNLPIKLRTKSGFQIGVVLVVPPFPYDDEKTFEVLSKDSVVFFKKPTEGVHLGDVKLVNGEWVVTGTSGVPLIVCGTGATMKQAQTQVYHRIKQINIPHMYYRTDIGDRWFEDSDKLHSWGYLREV
ncbi:MAG: phosphoribosylglycinamide synthetase C domain-containing protein [bacterium]|nr:phosphoribosylglycinamide synthetase C domain-containing protein [bacterium]